MGGLLDDERVAVAVAADTGRLSTALTWVPPEMLQAASTAGAPSLSEPESLVRLAQTLGVDIVWVPAEEAWAAEAAAMLTAEGMRPAWAAGGVFGRVAETLGWMEALRRSAGALGTLASALDRSLHELLTSIRAGADAGCDLLVVADDLAGSSGWVLSPDFALDAVLPSYCAAVREWPGDAIFHFDGDVRALMPSLARAGYQAVHLASLSGDALGQACEAAWSAGLVAVGGLPAAELELVKAAETAGRVAAGLATRGPLVVADDGGMTSRAQLAGLRRALESARSHVPEGQ